MKKECVACLCAYCTYYKTPTCRYATNKGFDPCSVRCYSVRDVVKINRQPRLTCDKFAHRAIHKYYIKKIKRNGRKEMLNKMSAADFLKMMGGNFNDH